MVIEKRISKLLPRNKIKKKKNLTKEREILYAKGHLTYLPKAPIYNRICKDQYSTMMVQKWQ